MDYRLNNTDSIISPALIYYEEALDRNVEKALQIVGDPKRLWPHVKTHKTIEIVSKLLAHKVTKFKCATIAECEMVARAGALEILLAYPAVGPNIDRLLNLKVAFPQVKFYALFDNLDCLKSMSQKAQALDLMVDYFIDVNVGNDRTGVEMDKVLDFAKESLTLPHITLAGLHCYDGQNGISDLHERERVIAVLIAQERELLAKLKTLGVDLCVIAGGSPEFSTYAKLSDFYVSPGTLFLQDNLYRSSFPDMPYECAACVLSRVISHPKANYFTLDCGNKAIAADPKIRGVIAGFEDKVEIILQNEEHWVFAMKKGFEHLRPKVGEVMYIIPNHICPTSALYPEALLARDHNIVGSYAIYARNRRLIY